MPNTLIIQLPGVNMKTSNLNISIFTAMLLAGVATTAGAGSTDPDTMARHEEAKARILEKLKAADSNGDGMISRDEANAGLPEVASHFDKIDTDKNGFITFQEFQATMHHARQRQGLKQLDKDGDLRISREESRAAPRLDKSFDAIDRNKDGFLDKEELKAAHQLRKSSKTS